jgi:two-component system chemotaxis response regulator CheY
MHHILLVEDSEYLRKVIGFTLKQAGYEVTCAGDGVEALQLASAQTFSLVVTDLNMPLMSGQDLIAQLQELPGYEEVGVICLTTETSQDELPEGIKTLVFAVVTKPFNPLELLDQIELLVAAG